MIDVQFGLDTLDVDVNTRLSEAGYRISESVRQDHVPPGGSDDPAEWAKSFATSTIGSRAVNLHVRRIGASNWRYALLFRDFLRANPVATSAYGQAKALLAPLCPSLGVYADAKDPICDLVMLAAKDWAAQTGWKP